MGGGAAAATATAAAAAVVAPAAGAGDGRMGLRQTHNLNPNSDSETDNSNGTAKSPSDVSSDDATTSEFSMYSALGRSERFCMGRVVFDLDMLPRNLAESTRRKRNRGGRRRPTVTGERDCNLSHHTEMGNEPNIPNVQSHNATPISESELLEGVFGLSAGGDNVPAGSRANPFSFEEDQYHARGSPLYLSHLSGSKPPITGHTLWTGHSLLSNEADPSGMTDSNRLTEELRVWADRREDGGVFDECGPRKESLSHTLSEPQHGSFETNEADQDSKELSDHMSVSDLKTELLEILSSADESVKSIMNSRRRKDEPSKKAGQNERANDSGKQTRLRATDENLRANASVLPRRRNPISFRPTEAQLRQSQSELSAVSFELRELSLTLSIKSEQLKLKERDIEAREAALDRYDEKVEKNASELFRLWKTSFEESIKKELDAFIRKYESALARTSRENRRLLANNVELGRSSKDFRDQIRGLRLELEEKDSRIRGMQYQMKSYKERLDRMKAFVAMGRFPSERPPNTSGSHYSVLFSQQSALAASECRNQKRRPREAPRQIKDVSTQTLSAGCIASPNVKTVKEESTNGRDLIPLTDRLLTVLVGMLQSKIERKSSENALWALPDFVVATLTSTQTLKAIATAFPLLSEFAEDCHSESEPIMKYSFGYNKIAEKGTSVQEKFLLFSLAVRRLLSEVSVCPEEQGQIISFASARFEQSLHSENGTPVQKMVELYPPRIRILLRLLILSTVHITPVSSALHSLERILEDLASSTGKMAFLSSRAVDFVHPWIQRKTHDSELHALVSSILLTLCGDADWAGEFLHQCADSPDFFVSAMAGMLHDKPFVRENFAVLMQKMSKIPELSRFIRNDTSFYKMLIDLETRVDSSDVTSSDFFFLNLRSILQNLESSQR